MLSGQERRQESANRELRLSRMQHARAMVGSGSSAWYRIECTSCTDGSIRETALGIRFERCMAGPGKSC
jgi:hypothetical protein